MQEKKPGRLFIVATPIGNYQDITLRAVDTLRESDIVVCEELRQGSTLLRKIGVGEKNLVLINEHNETEATEDVLQELLRGKTVALISDCGTPSFADPGTRLVRRCLEMSIPVSPIPGASSLTAAISLSPLPLKEFLFVGFLPRNSAERDDKLKRLKTVKFPIILMDTPYRLEKLIHEIIVNFGNDRLVTLALDLTLPTEKLIHGTVRQVAKNIKNRKGEFILILH